MGNCLSTGVNTLGSLVSALPSSRLSAAESPQANLQSLQSFGPYRPISTAQGDIWIGYVSGWLKPAGFVGYDDQTKKLPLRVRPQGFHIAARRGSQAQRALTEAFATLGADGLSEGALRAVFDNGHHPERLNALLTLIDFRLLDARHQHKITIPSSEAGAPPLFEGKINLVHRVALLGREPAPDQNGLTLLERFQGLRRARMSLHVLDPKGRTPLHFAAMFGNLAAVRALIDARVNLNTQCKEGYTPLALAAKASATSCVLALLEAGANPNLRTLRDQYAPLHLAAMKRDNGESVVCLRYLLEKGAHHTPQTFAMRTPLHFAAQAGDSNKVRILLRHGALPNLASKNHGTPLHIACRNRDTETARLLIASKAHPNLKDPKGKRALQLAQEAGATQSLIRLLNEAGAY